MPKTIKTRSGRTIILPTPEEDARITAAAMSDPDAIPFTDEEWERARPTARIGRPPVERPKKMVSLRLDQDVIDAWRASGPGWQTRMNAVLREWMQAHPQA